MFNHGNQRTIRWIKIHFIFDRCFLRGHSSNSTSSTCYRYCKAFFHVFFPLFIATRWKTAFLIRVHSKSEIYFHKGVYLANSSDVSGTMGLLQSGLLIPHSLMLYIILGCPLHAWHLLLIMCCSWKCLWSFFQLCWLVAIVRDIRDGFLFLKILDSRCSHFEILLRPLFIQSKYIEMMMQMTTQGSSIETIATNQWNPNSWNEQMGLGSPSLHTCCIQAFVLCSL